MQEDLEKQIEKKYASKDRKKRPRMKVTGKNVFKLKRIIEQKHDRLSQRKNSQKKR